MPAGRCRASVSATATQRLVAGVVAVVVVEQPEVVDVDERDAERPPVVARALDLAAPGAPTSAPWLSVSVSGSRRVDSSEGGGLARQPRLRGAEDEEQQPGRDERRGERHDDDLAAHPVEAGQDRARRRARCRRRRGPRRPRSAAGTRAGPSAMRASPARPRPRRPARWRPAGSRRAASANVAVDGGSRRRRGRARWRRRSCRRVAGARRAGSRPVAGASRAGLRGGRHPRPAAASSALRSAGRT